MSALGQITRTAALLSVGLLPLTADAETLRVNKNAAACNDATGTPRYCTIQAAVDDAVDGDIVVVGPTTAATYTENVSTGSKNITLRSARGRDVITIEGVTDGSLGTILVSGTSDFRLGGNGRGFTIIGIDNGSAGVENAAVYFQGSNSGVEVLDNEIVAYGDGGLLSEYGGTNSGFLIDGNIFSGKTFIGTEPGGCGFGMQFMESNVPRQLVVVSGGGGGGNTSNITFTNNQVTGTAGGPKPGCGDNDEQGNTLVTIDSNGATIQGNTFAGTTTRYGTSLRARGPLTTINSNDFDRDGLGPQNCHVLIENTGETLGTVDASNTFEGATVLVPDNPAATEGSICPGPDEDADGVPDADDNCAMSDTDDPVDVNGTDTDPEVDNREIETAVPFLDDSGPGCFLQDLVDQAFADAGSNPAAVIDNILELGIFLDREDEIFPSEIFPSESFSLRVASARAAPFAP